jgi:LPXTG-motif cell wall-anchored protein
VKKRLAVGIATAGWLFIGVFGSSVAAQYPPTAPADASAPAAGPSIIVDPSSVSEPGTYDFTVSGSGFTDSGFLLPCPGANGDPAAIAEDSCDLTSLTPYPAGDWSLSVTYDVPAEGLVLVAGNAAQTEVLGIVITIGDAGDLPNTGANTNVYLMTALVLVIGSLMFFVAARRRSEAESLA